MIRKIKKHDETTNDLKNNGTRASEAKTGGAKRSEKDDKFDVGTVEVGMNDYMINWLCKRMRIIIVWLKETIEVIESNN